MEEVVVVDVVEVVVEILDVVGKNEGNCGDGNDEEGIYMFRGQ